MTVEVISWLYVFTDNELANSLNPYPKLHIIILQSFKELFKYRFGLYLRMKN